ncbi:MULTISPECIES: MFS transporter [Tenebrionibacter/Tenebrionicola group]|jgi:DHA2 family multidrug resistance protein-like MFS transporter|uniref:MFS transporter n=2 Tax=Tenebrionibacter/Tenebrionicola group TaxID=2969848 RepID=A0A8K0V5M8_9ENTR|nr:MULTISPECIES: MFS transporter [Tenebrionibacter/Tenebrionicola group]MBK4715858.1 MFS transporter [Tenebrionibacter intestinalis]MBV4411415.1 MFS transporter [Tenebrionicola larvae]MBV5096586.1 MFS transporter [Tenebrionicola larvae]
MSTILLDNARFVGNDRLLTGIVLGVLTFWLFAQSMINVVPAIEASVAIPVETLTMAVSLSALFSGCFIVASGSLADRFGRMRLTRLGLMLSVLGCLMLVIAQGPLLFLLGRAVQGFSAACIMPATLALLKEWYDGKARQRAISFWVIGSWGGSGLSSFVGGAIATGLGWRWIFIVSSGVALLALYLLRNAPESRSAMAARTKLDWGGLISLAVTLVLLNLFISKGRVWGWASAESFTMLGATLVAACCFWRLERVRQGGNALIDFELFRNRAWSGATLSNMLLNGCVGTMMIASIYMQQGRSFSSFKVGIMTLGYLVTVLAMIRVGERLLQRYGARLPMMAGPTITGAGVMLLSCTFLSDAAYIIAVFLGYILFGLGLGCYATPSTDTAVTHAPGEKAGVASGIYKMGSSLGGAFGIAGSASLFALLMTFGIERAAQFTLLANTGLCLLAVMVSWLMVPRSRS